jgi:diguanylate cyclase (GGDEF)-like protein
LCAYGAIALDNATAYRQIESTLKTLRDTQAELIEKNNLLAKAYQSLEDVSLTDPLTGLRNRRFLLQHLEADVAMTLRRYDERYLTANSNLVKDADLLFFLVDIDHFKSVNDQFGHAAGDAVLMEVGRRLRQVVRESDYLIRWGGEEFLLVARATNRREAELVAERIRTIIAETAFDLPDGQKLMKTCSVGYACFPFLPSKPGLLTWFQVVELADQGLYMAKNRGRDAWVGVSCTDLTQADDIYQRLLQKTSEAAKRGEIRLVSSRPLQMEVARTQSPA